MNVPITYGNKKLPRNFGILNIGPAATCPSRALGMCQLSKCGLSPDKCYALNAEMRYGVPHTLPHRMAQTAFWDQDSHIMRQEVIKHLASKRARPSAIRLGESGDFRHAGDISKLCMLAEDSPDLVFYAYTARRDLFTSKVLKGLSKNITINGSGWMAHNNYLILAGTQANRKVGYVCPGDCRICNMCLRRSRTVIGAKLH